MSDTLSFYQENLDVHSWMIFCPDGIIPDSGLTRPNYTHTHTHMYIYIYYINFIFQTIILIFVAMFIITFQPL